MSECFANDKLSNHPKLVLCPLNYVPEFQLCPLNFMSPEFPHYVDDWEYTSGASDYFVHYQYDAFNRLVGETVCGDGKTQHTVYVYQGNQIVAQFDNSGGNLAATDLSHRYLWNPQAADQLFADEQVHYDTDHFVTDQLLWALTDHQNSVRDMVTYASGVTTERIHRIFDSFGNMIEEDFYDASGNAVGWGESGAFDCLFGFTGRPATNLPAGWLPGFIDLQYNGSRWYDPQTGTWLSKDPSGLGPDVNPYRYCGNSPTTHVDPSGLSSLLGDTWHTTFVAAPPPVSGAPHSYLIADAWFGSAVLGPYRMGGTGGFNRGSVLCSAVACTSTITGLGNEVATELGVGPPYGRYWNEGASWGQIAVAEIRYVLVLVTIGGGGGFFGGGGDYIGGLMAMIKEGMARAEAAAAIGDLEEAALLYRQVQELTELLLEITGGKAS